MSTNFSDLLSQKTGDVEAPKPLPVGTYNGKIQSWDKGTSTVKGTPYVEFTVKLDEIGEDVDAEDFADYGGVKILVEKEFKVQYYLSERAIFMLAEFMKSLGLPKTKTLAENLPNTIGADVTATVAHELNESAGTVFSRIRRLIGIS